MGIIFRKSDDGRRCLWRAELPHDLVQFVEAELGHEHGFWNLVANGATFHSIGRRPARPGRQLTVEWPTRRLPKPAPRAQPGPARRRRAPR